MECLTQILRFGPHLSCRWLILVKLEWYFAIWRWRDNSIKEALWDGHRRFWGIVKQRFLRPRNWSPGNTLWLFNLFYKSFNPQAKVFSYHQFWEVYFCFLEVLFFRFELLWGKLDWIYLWFFGDSWLAVLSGLVSEGSSGKWSMRVSGFVKLFFVSLTHGLFSVFVFLFISLHSNEWTDTPWNTIWSRFIWMSSAFNSFLWFFLRDVRIGVFCDLVVFYCRPHLVLTHAKTVRCNAGFHLENVVSVLIYHLIVLGRWIIDIGVGHFLDTDKLLLWINYNWGLLLCRIHISAKLVWKLSDRVDIRTV